MTDLIDIARAAGLTVLLDGQIGREQYHSVTGSMQALKRFAELYYSARGGIGSLVERLKNRAALQIDDTDALIMREAARVVTRMHYQSQASEAFSPAARDVLRERARHRSVEGWTSEHDDEHADGELALAAAAYACSAAAHDPESMPSMWPFADQWWKPSSRRRSLEKAGALILAEIERIDRDENAALGSIASEVA